MRISQDMVIDSNRIKKFRLQNQSQNSSKTNEISKHSR